MKDRKRLFPMLWAMLVLSIWSGQAQATSFDFAFTGDPSHPGTVTGEILGLREGSFIQATGIVIDTATMPLPVFLSYNFFKDPTVSAPVNSFMVSGGQVVANAVALGITTEPTGDAGFSLVLSFNNIAGYESGVGPIWETSLALYEDGQLAEKIADDSLLGTGSLTFAPVLEPGALAVFGTALVGLAMALGGTRRQRGERVVARRRSTRRP